MFIFHMTCLYTLCDDPRQLRGMYDSNDKKIQYILLGSCVAYALALDAEHDVPNVSIFTYFGENTIILVQEGF